MDGDGAIDGDQACWLHLVCEECGALVTPRDGHRPSCSCFVPNTVTLDDGNKPSLPQR